MPARSTVTTLPRVLRERLDELIIEQGFGGYAELVAWLESEGHRVSWSALQRYGRNLRQEVAPELERIRVSTAKAHLLVQELQSEGGVAVKADAVLGLIQERMFEAIVDGSPGAELEALGGSARAAAAAARAQAAVSRERRAARREAGEDAAREATRQGVSPEGIAAIRAAVEGSG